MNNKELLAELDKAITIVCRRIIGRDEVVYIKGVFAKFKAEIERLEKEDDDSL